MLDTTHPAAVRQLSVALFLGCSLMACGSCGGGTENVSTGTPTTGANEPPPLFDQEAELGEASEQVGRARVQRHDVAIAEAGTVVVTVSSSAFDPVLYVTTTDGRTLSNDDWQGSREHAQVQVELTAPGTLKVAIASSDGAGAGRYRLLVRRATTDGQPELVAVGSSRRGELGAGDPRLPDGRPYDTILVQGPSAVTVSAEGAALPMVAVMDPSGQPVWQGSNGAWSLVGAGIHRVQIMAPQANATAEYEVRVAASAPQTTPTLSRNHHQLPTGAAGATLAMDQTVRGDLSDTDGHLPTGEPADVWGIELPAGQDMSITLESGAFDSYLMVVAPNGQYFENDDDGGTLNARVTFAPPVPGTYRVVATAYRATDRGAYELKVLRGAAAVADAAAGSGSGSGASGAEQHVRGALAQGDQTLSSGELMDEHRFTLAAGQSVRFRATSSQFDTYLIVKPPSGAQIDNDDAPGGGTDAQVDLVAQEAGEYRVLVTSYRAGEAGAYDLVVTGVSGAGGTTPPTVTPPQNPQNRPVVASGQETRGSLARNDQTLQSGEFADRVEMSFDAGQSVQLRLASSQFDTYLIVRTPSGRQIDNDDLASGSTNSGVDIPVAEPGTYAVTVTSYRPGETGAWTLTRSAGASVPRPVAQGGGGGGGQGGRVFGLFAGISDYPGSGDLAECANDAVKLAETLRNEGLLAAENQIVLTDGQATVANIRSSMQRMQSQVGPNDVFVFFYSGHGGQTSGTQDAREIDGKDEYLAVYDGQLVDDELGRLFDGLRSRIALVALDSCHSGGFAKDIITRPGRVGLFSSEEDVLSAVASQFQAGGYLSHFLRVAMGGQADANPHDGVLTVGELTHDVYTQFGSHAQDVHLAAAYQHLVVDRGAVGVDQVLWSTR
jgi:hypothetical protein